jgi:hypothetical protein
MKTFRLSSTRVIAALAFIAVILAIILLSAHGTPALGVLMPMQYTHGYAPFGAVCAASLNC